MNNIYQIASAAAETPGSKPGLFEALGVDVTMLVLQSVAFLALLWLLGKYAFPVLMRTLDERDAKIAEGQQAAAEAVAAALKVEHTTAKTLAQAKKDAAAIVETAHKEASRIADEAEARASKKADHVLEQAEARIQSEMSAAKDQLHSELVTLVAAATEKVLGAKLDAKADAELIRRALQEEAK